MDLNSNRLQNTSTASSLNNREARNAYQRQWRARRTEAQKALRRQADASYREQRTASLNEEQRVLRRETNAQRQRNVRAAGVSSQRMALNAAQQRTYTQRRINDQIARNNLQIQAESVANDDESTVLEHYCGKLEDQCYECKALHFTSESSNFKTIYDVNGGIARVKTFTKCCKNGQIKLDELPHYPEPFLTWMKNEDAMAKNFMENIRAVNSSFAFASMGANIKPPPGYGPYCFRIHGQIYHRASTLHPPAGNDRQYGQLYILDTEQANAERANHSSNGAIDSSVFQLIADFMERNNPITQAYKMLYQVEQESIHEAQANGIQVKEVTMAIVHDRKSDPRRHNAATANEVAVVFTNKDGLPPTNWDLLIHAKCAPDDQSKGMQRIDVTHKNLEALTYPILFPYGDQGWGVDLLRNKTGTRSRISQMEYYSYRLAIRENFNALLSAGKLTQQYFVDAYVKNGG